MDRSKARVVVSAIVAVAGIALPETGWFGPDLARLIVLICVGLLLLLLGPMVWAWVTARLMPVLPVTFRTPVVRRAPKMPRPMGELGTLDFEAAAMQALTDITKIMGRMGKDMSGSAKVIASYTRRFESAVNAPIQTKMRLSTGLASKLS